MEEGGLVKADGNIVSLDQFARNSAELIKSLYTSFPTEYDERIRVCSDVALITAINGEGPFDIWRKGDGALHEVTPLPYKHLRRYVSVLKKELRRLNE